VQAAPRERPEKWKKKTKGLIEISTCEKKTKPHTYSAGRVREKEKIPLKVLSLWYIRRSVQLMTQSSPPLRSAIDRVLPNNSIDTCRATLAASALLCGFREADSGRRD
jgi:hypothetical protein